MLTKQITRFLLAGAVGFIVDLSVMAGLIHGVQAPVLPSRVVAFVCAIVVTYVINARYTYEIRTRDASLWRYGLVQVVGAAINLGTFAWLVLGGWLVERPLVALACGAFLSTISNFLLTRRFVFLRR